MRIIDWSSMALRSESFIRFVKDSLKRPLAFCDGSRWNDLSAMS
jgi:hypothetical protein